MTFTFFTKTKFLVINTKQPIEIILEALKYHNDLIKVNFLGKDGSLTINDTAANNNSLHIQIIPDFYDSPGDAINAIKELNSTLSAPFLLELNNVDKETLSKEFLDNLSENSIIKIYKYDCKNGKLIECHATPTNRIVDSERKCPCNII